MKQCRHHDTVLDVGCGTDTLTISPAQALPEATVIGLDIDGTMLVQAHTKTAETRSTSALVQGSAVALPWAAGSIDTVVASMMVHHLATAQKEALFVEARRVLSPGGSFLLLDFNAPKSDWQTAMARTFVRFEQIDDNLYGRLPAMLRAAGFRRVDVNWQAFNGVLTLYRASMTA